LESRPENQVIMVTENQEETLSKGRFMIWYELKTRNDTLQKVLIELSKAIYNYKNYVSKDFFKSEYSELHDSCKYFIDSLLDHTITLHRIDYKTLRPIPRN
jgi:hypothetical protein